MPRPAWEPLLDGCLAEQARGAVRAIAGQLAAFEAAADTSLSGGAAGLAVFFTYLDAVWPGEEHDETAFRFLNEAIEETAGRMAPALYDGFTGVAWAVTHLEGRLLDPGDGDPAAAIDAALLDYLARTPWEDHYDLVSGLVGCGVYGLERLPREGGRAVLERVIDRLADLAEQGPEGITWFTAPHLLPDRQRAVCPQGYYNLGLAHGVPGVIALLGSACAARIREETARTLLGGAVPWLMAQRLPPDAGGSFSSWTGPGVPREPARLAWCYGDLGVAAALLVTARVVGNAEWEREAVGIGLGAAARDTRRSGVRDAGLCHGAAGNAHLFNRIYQATGEPQFGEAARFWLARALEMRRPGCGIGGFQACTAIPGSQPAWTDEPGLLTGAAGIALALLAAVTDTEPEWDRLLLISGSQVFR